MYSMEGGGVHVRWCTVYKWKWKSDLCSYREFNFEFDWEKCHFHVERSPLYASCKFKIRYVGYVIFLFIFFSVESWYVNIKLKWKGKVKKSKRHWYNMILVNWYLMKRLYFIFRNCIGKGIFTDILKNYNTCIYRDDVTEAGTFGECWRFSPNVMFGNARKSSRTCTSFLLSLLLTIPN